MRKLSVRPTFSLHGRKFKGLRGWAGKPTHPPLTDFPIVAYLFAAAFDVIATFGQDDTWARDFFSRRDVCVHRRGRCLDPRCAHRLLGLDAIDGEGHPGTSHCERARVDDDRRDRARTDRHRCCA